MAIGMGGHSPSNVLHNLRGIDFPATKQQLIDHARQQNAEPAVIEVLQHIPEDDYHSMADVLKGVGKAE